MKKKYKILTFIIVGIVALFIGKSAVEHMVPAIGILRIEGPITDSNSSLETINEYKDDESIKAVVVRIDSGGGRVGSSQEIYSALLKLKDKKPVIASMGSTAASGGYYVACAADSIVALPGTMTGSIGVISEFVNVSEGLQKLGVKVYPITSGQMKDAGSPFRDMTGPERAYFEAMVKDIHEQFVEVVSQKRKIPMDKVRGFSDGRVFTGRQAYSLGLIDGFGGLNDAIDKAKEISGVKDRVRIIDRQERFQLIDYITNILGNSSQGNSLTRHIRLEYSLY